MLSLPNVNPAHAYSAQCIIDEKIVGGRACFQAAVLHTSTSGERRIRVLNLGVQVSDDIREVFGAADQGVLVNLLAKMAVEKALNSKLEDARDALVNKCIDVMGALAQAFGTKSAPSAASQLFTTDSLKSFPLLILALLKSVPFRGGNVTPPDYRSFWLTLLRTLPVTDSLHSIHPYLCALHQMTEAVGVYNAEGTFDLPPALMLSAEYISPDGIYLLWNGQDVYIWVGLQAHPELVQALLAKPLASIQSGKVRYAS